VLQIEEDGKPEIFTAPVVRTLCVPVAGAMVEGADLRSRIASMRVATGKVVQGKIVYEGELPEGAEVTLLAHEPEDTFEVSPELKAVLLESIAQCERGETISAEDLIAEMISRE